MKHTENTRTDVSQKHLYQKSHKLTSILGFTLVELIVVITILVILGTIAFINLGGFASSARDGRRVSDMSNITQSIELSVVTQGSAPIPTNPVSYTGGSITIQAGIINNTTLPKMSGDFSDPITKAPYNYSVFGNGLYYQIGIDFENPLSYHIGIPGIETVYADNGVKYSKLSGSYKIDPSLPSLFILTGAQNTASGGIFSPDVCFVMNNVSTNTFSSTASGCKTKKDINLKDIDNSLVGYWDMETLTNSGLLKDLSGNGNNGSGISLGGTLSTIRTGGIIGKSSYLSGDTDRSFYDFYTSGTILSNIPSKGDFTIEAVIKDNYSTGNTWGTIASTYQGGAPVAGWFLRTFQNPTGGRFLCFDIPFSVQRLRLWSMPGDIQPGMWYIVTAKFFSSQGTAKLYINGIELTNFSVNNKGIGSYNNETYPGTNYDMNGFDIGKAGHASMSGGGQFWNGNLDEVKIYSRALSDNEIKQQAKIAGF